YNDAFPESKSVEGHVAFMPGVVTEFDLAGNKLNPLDDGNIVGPTVDWIMREAWLCETPQELTAATARKLLEEGVAITRMSVMIWSLHPMIAGKIYVWSKHSDAVETYTPSYDIHAHPAFVNSPYRHVSNGLGGVRQRLNDDGSEFRFPILQDLKMDGATDYVAMPLPFSGGQTNVLTMACDHPSGFTTANLGLVFETSAVLSRYYEVFALKENAQSLLETYLGKRTGKRVLGGEIRRGDGDEIDAAILFCDLRESTRLESTLGRDDYIKLLNGFFEETTEIINAHGGEVLKFIGDAVLAIFPADEERNLACEQALTSAKEIVSKINASVFDQPSENIDCAIGIAFGGVTYGNVGSRERLDFTVIGSAANIAARLGDFGKRGTYKIVATADIAQSDPESITLGKVALHNVDQTVEAFAIA
ncbi:MAG: adenylate/guanylate cyclase domain-containing protein, partial [Stappiaceae bacterium]